MKQSGNKLIANGTKLGNNTMTTWKKKFIKTFQRSSGAQLYDAMIITIL